MTLRPTSFRLDEATLERLKTLRREHEPLAAVIARALEALEAAQDAPVTEGTLTGILARLDALEARLDALAAPSAARQTSLSPYPEDARKLAVELTDKGWTPAQVRNELIARFGRAPDLKNIGKLISGWRSKLSGSGTTGTET